MRVKITIKKLGINGEGIGYFKKKITFIKGALPGEVVFAETTKETDRYIEADLVKVLQKSEDRVKPVCDKFEECGGCQTLHFDEDAHMMSQRNPFLDAFVKYPGVH